MIEEKYERMYYETLREFWIRDMNNMVNLHDFGRELIRKTLILNKEDSE